METVHVALKILVAEDNPTTARILSVFLSKKGWQADVVNNGKDVLTALAQKEYDLILMDALMPEMTGYEAAKLIRSGSGCTDIPIIALTANSGAGEKESCLAAGMNDYLAKPFNSSELYNMIEKYMPRKVS